MPSPAAHYLASFRTSRLRESVRNRTAEYAPTISEQDRRAWQLSRINEIWSVVSERVPAHAERVRSGRVPRRFDSLEQFAATVPPLTKRDMQTNAAALTDPSRPADQVYSTGGSTGQPTIVPGWKSESLFLVPDRWMAREWYGITPADSLFLLWGHGHLMGTGVKGKLKTLARGCKDRMLGYHRFSALNLSAERMGEAADRILRLKPGYIIGFSCALDHLARANRHRSGEFAALGLKAAIASGEIFPFNDSVATISSTFSCPVAMEYGSIETGVMAHTLPPTAPGTIGRFQMLWRSYFVEAGEPGPLGGRRLYITSLYPRKFPLVRFQIGDEAELVDEDQPLGLARMARVIGRSLEPINLPDGGAVHFDIFERAATTCACVRRFQLVIKGEELILNLEAPGANREATRREILDMIRRLDPRVSGTRIDFVDNLLQTQAGKTPTLLRLPVDRH